MTSAPKARLFGGDVKIGCLLIFAPKASLFGGDVKIGCLPTSRLKSKPFRVRCQNWLFTLHMRFQIIRQVFRDFWRGFKLEYLSSRDDRYGYKDKTATVLMPSNITKENVYLYEHTNIGEYATIRAVKGKFILKKYCTAAFGLTVVCQNHPFFEPGTYPSSTSWTEEIGEDVIVEDGVWIGANVTLLPGTHIGRGCMVASGAVCTGGREYPPYTVIAGVPAKVIKFRFSLEDQMKHEEMVIPENERLDKNVLKSNYERISEKLSKKQ